MRGPVTRRLAAAAVAVLAALSLAALSRVPYRPGATDGALLRLSWRMQPPSGANALERCEAPDEEELERLPEHMRGVTVCRERPTSWRLQVAVDGERVLDDSVRSAGARGDRPVYVLRDVPLRPGAHRLAVRVSPIGVREEEDDPTISFDGVVTPGRGEIVLLTWDAQGRRLYIVRSPTESRASTR